MTICTARRPLPQGGFSATGNWLRWLVACLCALALAGCASTGSKSGGYARFGTDNLPPTPQGQEVTIMAMQLIDTGYRYGGKNPEAGLDCSGLVSWLYEKAAAYNLKGSARDMAKRGRPITPAAIRPGDLVFFNTEGFSYSHVGIYIGDQRFVHAPSTGGRVRIDRLDRGWFAPRFEQARSYF